MDETAFRKARSRRAVRVVAPLLAWWLALAVWMSVGGGFAGMMDNPYPAMVIMSAGTIVVVVLCMVLGRVRDKTAGRP